MTRSVIRALAVVAAGCFIAVGCSNSGSTSSSSTTAAPAGSDSVGGGGGGDASRDEFVARPGVPGVTDEEISYAVIGTKTGNPLGICILDCYVEGIEAYFAYRNSEGGIYGRDLVVGEVLDDELVQNQQRALDVISAEDVFGVFSATLLPAGWGDLDAAGIPNYAWGIHAADSANRVHNFPSLAVRCPDCVQPTVPYVAAQSGATKAASLGYGVSENSKVCTATVAAAFERYEDQSGVEVVYTNSDLQFGLPNGIGAQVSAMKAAGVDFISTCIDLNGMKTLATELERQGMEDVVLYHPNSYDQTFIEESGDLFEGDVVSVQFRPLEASAEGNALAEFEKWMGERGSAPSELAMVGWINASLAFEGLLEAGPEFDRESVTAATNAIDDWTADGLITPLDWTVAHEPFAADNPQPETSCAAMVRIEGGTFVPFTSATEPWFCWDDASRETFEPTPTDFE